MPVKVSAGVPASSVNATAEVDPASRFRSNPSTGVAMKIEVTAATPAGAPALAGMELGWNQVLGRLAREAEAAGRSSARPR